MRKKLLEHWKTTTKKSTSDLLNFYVFLAVTTWSLILTGLPYASATSKRKARKQKQKREDLPKIWVAPKYCLKISDEEKEKKHYSWPWRKKSSGTQEPYLQQLSNEEVNWRNAEKSGIWTKLLEHCKTPELRSQLLTCSISMQSP